MRFPVSTYGGQKMQFFEAPFSAPIRSFAGLGFLWDEDRILLANIRDRGWSIPSGRVEELETSKEAVRREAIEEAGAIVGDPQYFGCFQLGEGIESKWADCFVARVEQYVSIVMTEESEGRFLATLEELPNLYYLWNPLTQMVFEYSREVLDRAGLNQAGG